MHIGNGLRRRLLALALVGLCGCGGSGGGGGGGGDTATRNAAINNALTAFGDIHEATPDAENQKMLAWFQANPEFIDSGITEGNVWAHTKDHTTVVMVSNRQVPDNDGGRSAPVGATRLPIDIPSSKTARLINNFGKGNGPATSQISSMLAIGGYTGSPATASISELGNLTTSGVFYIDSHGLSLTEDDRKDTYYLMTSDPYDENNTTTHDAGLRSHFLSVLGEKISVRQPDGSIKEISVGNYAISDRYASANWSANTFGQNSFVFINACSSAKTNVFRDVCFAKGASGYAGWSGDVDNAHALKVAPFVFDRLLGADKVEKEADGAQRPFDYTKIAADLGKHGLSADKNGVTLSIMQKPSTDFGLLTPTIAYMGVDERKKELTITGTFGTQQGKVTVGGTEVAVRSWGYQSVVCDLPTGLAGDTIVEVRGHKSNVVQLTQWKAQFITHFELEPGSPFMQDGFLDINFRADVHSHRDDPHQQPIDPIVPFEQEQDSHGQFTASGTKTEPGPPSVTTTWGGTADLQATSAGGGGSSVLICLGSIDVKQKKIDIALQATSVGGMTVTVSPPGTVLDLAGTTGFLDGEFGGGNPLPTLHLTLNDDFSINAGVREEFQSGALFRLQWAKITPTSPPDKTAARSAVVRR